VVVIPARIVAATLEQCAAKGVQAFQKVHPGKNYGTFVNNVRDYSDMQQRLVMQIVSMAERAK
jgi:hypothetical protein